MRNGDKIDVPFLSLFQQGKDIKDDQYRQRHSRLRVEVSIPFSAGQRHKEKGESYMKPTVDYGFYPFFSRAKT